MTLVRAEEHCIITTCSPSLQNLIVLIYQLDELYAIPRSGFFVSRFSAIRHFTRTVSPTKRGFANSPSPFEGCEGSPFEKSYPGLQPFHQRETEQPMKNPFLKMETFLQYSSSV